MRENSCLIGIRRCKMRVADVVRSSQREADITLNLAYRPAKEVLTFWTPNREAIQRHLKFAVNRLWPNRRLCTDGRRFVQDAKLNVDALFQNAL